MALTALRLLWAVGQAKTHTGTRHAGGPKNHPERELYRRAKIKRVSLSVLDNFDYRPTAATTRRIPRRDIGRNARRGDQGTLLISLLQDPLRLLLIPSRQICTDARYTHYPPSQPTSSFETSRDVSPRPLCSLFRATHTHTQTQPSKHASARLTSDSQGNESLVLRGTGRRSPAARGTPSPARPSWT